MPAQDLLRAVGPKILFPGAFLQEHNGFLLHCQEKGCSILEPGGPWPLRRGPGGDGGGQPLQRVCRVEALTVHIALWGPFSSPKTALSP